LVTGNSISNDLPLLRSVYRPVFIASVVEQSDGPMNIGSFLYSCNSILQGLLFAQSVRL